MSPKSAAKTRAKENTKDVNSECKYMRSTNQECRQQPKTMYDLE